METKKVSKASRKAADNLTCLYSKSYEINTRKSQVDKSVLVAQLIENISSLESDQKPAK